MSMMDFVFDDITMRAVCQANMQSNVEFIQDALTFGC